MDTPELPGLELVPRPGVRPAAELERELVRILGETRLGRDRSQLLRALVLLWHDHLDAAHALVQDAAGGDGALIHAILHRREPDFWNSKYWFRRAGMHPAFKALGTNAAASLKARGDDDLSARLIPGGEWDPFAFVDACEAALKLPTTNPRYATLRELQRLECEAVLGYLTSDLTSYEL
jgi:hypothetical protein